MAHHEVPPLEPEQDLSQFAPLPQPLIPAVIDPDDPDGLVYTGTQENDLDVRVPVWPVLPPDGQADILRLFMGTPPIEVDSARITGPVDPGISEFLMEVPKLYLQPDGRYDVSYQVEGWQGQLVDSLPRTITIDTRPPSYDKQLEALLLPTDLTNGLIDQAYLDSHGGIVELRVPRPLYLGAEAGDVLSLYWSRSNPPTNAALKRKPITQAELDAEDIRVELTADEIAAPATDGLFYATYKVRDRAGNEAPFSRETTAVVALRPGQGDYPEAEFPDADKWGYYLCEHKPWEGIKVRVPLAAGFAVQDRVSLMWEGFETLNGVNPIAGTKGRFEAQVAPADLTAGYLDIWVRPYQPYIEPIVEGSGTARYLVTKFTGQTGMSRQNLVKINRTLPGGELCGPARRIPLARQPWWRRLLHAVWPTKK